MSLPDYRNLRDEINSLLISRYPHQKLHSSLARAINFHLGPTPTAPLEDFLSKLSQDPSLWNWKGLLRTMLPDHFSTGSRQKTGNRRSTETIRKGSANQDRTSKYRSEEIPEEESVRKKRASSQRLSEKLPALLDELSQKGIKPTTLQKILARPRLAALAQNRNFNIGLTVAQNNNLYDRNQEFVEIWRPFDLRLKRAIHNGSALDTLRNEMALELESFLEGWPLRVAQLKLRQADQAAMLRVFKGALFYGMFRDLLALYYLDSPSPFKSESKYLRHVIDFVEPGTYLDTVALDPEKHLWREIIQDLQEAISPNIQSRKECNAIIVSLLKMAYPTVFNHSGHENESRLLEKVRQVTRKAPSPKTQS